VRFQVLTAASLHYENHTKAICSMDKMYKHELLKQVIHIITLGFKGLNKIILEFQMTLLCSLCVLKIFLYLKINFVIYGT
jgi:hypothetical protein